MTKSNCTKNEEKDKLTMISNAEITASRPATSPDVPSKPISTTKFTEFTLAKDGGAD